MVFQEISVFLAIHVFGPLGGRRLLPRQCDRGAPVTVSTCLPVDGGWRDCFTTWVIAAGNPCREARAQAWQETMPEQKPESLQDTQELSV